MRIYDMEEIKRVQIIFHEDIELTVRSNIKAIQVEEKIKEYMLKNFKE